VSDIPKELSEQEQLLKVVAGLVPATAQQVGAALGKLSMRLEELTHELALADEKSTHLSEEYQMAFDKAFLLAGASAKVKVTEAVRNAEARIATYALRLDAEVAKLHVRSLKAAHRTLDRRIDVGRTQAATVRSEARSIGYAVGA
jgi:hypothetical protein